MMSHHNPPETSSGPWGYPLLGHMPDFLRDKLGFLSRCAMQYGDVVKLNIGGPTFLLNNPEDIKHVLVMNPDNYDKSPRLTSPRGKRLSGEGLLTSVGTAHLKQRRMMQPAFYRTSIQAFAVKKGDPLALWLTGRKSGCQQQNNNKMIASHIKNCCLLV